MKPIRHLTPLKKNWGYLRYALWLPEIDRNKILWTWFHEENRQDPIKPLMFRISEALKKDLEKC